MTRAIESLSRCPGRRCALGAMTAAGVAVLSGCAVYGDQQSSRQADPTPQPASTPSEVEGSAAPPLARLDDVPVGGGLVLAAARLVLTRPIAETVKAFSAVCTHAGCVVSDVADGTVNCACHGSRFAIEDGAPTAGPARTPLAPVGVILVDGAVVRP
jgi:Rieske Fe-S protein